MRLRDECVVIASALAAACGPLDRPTATIAGQAAPSQSSGPNVHGASAPSVAPARVNGCVTDDDCTVTRFDEHSATPCCTCKLVAVSKAVASSSSCNGPTDPDAGLLSGVCVLSCLQAPGIAARCTDGSCTLTK